jgi:teichuronic acid exporter
MLKQKATKAVGWSAANQFLQYGLHFTVSIILARLITPEDFGTVALMYIFTGLASVFRDGGLSAALIQKKSTTLIDESTVFWFNIGIAALFTTALFLSAPWIAGFYELPILVLLAQIYSLEFFVSSFNSVQATLFRKRLDFKTPLKIWVISAILSALIGVALAFKGYGIWALVAMAMANTLTRTIALWILSPWRPLCKFSGASFRALFSFGGYLFLSQLLNVGYERFYTLLIGKWFGVYELGIYNRASNVQKLPAESLSRIINQVAFPIFSQTNNDSDKLVRGLRFSLRSIMLVNIPMMIGLALVAEPLILTLYGEAWLTSVPLLSILALSGILYPLHLLNLSVLQSMGHSAKFFRVAIIKKATGVTFLIIGARWGITGMAWAIVASSCFSFFFNAYYNGKFLKHGALAQIRDFAPILLCALPMAALVYYCSVQFQLIPILQLIALSAIGAVTFLLVAYLTRLSALHESVAFAKSALKRKAATPVKT